MESEFTDAEVPATTSPSCKWVISLSVFAVATLFAISAISLTHLYGSSKTEAAIDEAELKTEVGATENIKRGLGIVPTGQENNGLCGDARALGLGKSWFYTWTDKPGECTDPVTTEFVPMVQLCKSINAIWDSRKQDVQADIKSTWIQHGAKFLLGFNEPDRASSTTCTPNKAAQAWLTVQKIAKAFNPPLRLVSPAPVSGHDKDHTADEQGCAFGECPWLTSFFKECKDLAGCNPDDIEFIAFHDYEGGILPLVDEEMHPDNLQKRVAGLVKNYPFSNGTKRQIWLTETTVACGGTSVCRDCPLQKKYKYYRDGACGYPVGSATEPYLKSADHQKYMKPLLTFLDGSPDIYRYAWFGERHTPNNGFSGEAPLLPWYPSKSMDPTPLGELYVRKRR